MAQFSTLHFRSSQSATSYSKWAGNVCHHMVTQGLPVGWIKEWSHEKNENNHRVHTKRTQPEGAHHIENTAFQSCTLNNQHSQLFHVVHRQISSHNRVNDFCQNVHTNSFSYHWHCILFCDGTAVSQVFVDPFVTMPHPLWPPVLGAHVPPALVAFHVLFNVSSIANCWTPFTSKFAIRSAFCLCSLKMCCTKSPVLFSVVAATLLHHESNVLCTPPVSFFEAIFASRIFQLSAA